MAYTVSTFDVCQPGCERWRLSSELLLVARVSPRAGWRRLQAEFFAELDATKPEDMPPLAYRAARLCIDQFSQRLRGTMGRKGIGARYGAEAGCHAFLYLKRTPDMGELVELTKTTETALRTLDKGSRGAVVEIAPNDSAWPCKVDFGSSVEPLQFWPHVDSFRIIGAEA